MERVILYKEVEEFTEEFPEFTQVNPTPMIAVFAWGEGEQKEIIINIEQKTLKSFHRLSIVYKKRLEKYAEKNNFRLEISFEPK